jgi:hypothetical protein
MAFSRRRILATGAGAGASAIAGALGIYRLVDHITDSPPRAKTIAPIAWPAEQHVMLDLPLVLDGGLQVVQRPLHHQILTAALTVPPDRAGMISARRRLEEALQQLERIYPPTPAGLGMALAWGLPYFRRYVPAAAAQHLPVDLRASQDRGARTPALEDAVRFPSDPDDVLLEDNDLAVLLRSDSLDHIAAAASIFTDQLRDFCSVTSIRRGFVGGGYGGTVSLPKRMAVAAAIPGADQIPESAELFMGFTSGGMDSVGRGQLANCETIPGLIDLGASDYCRRGTVMALSHIYEDLAGWYAQQDYAGRLVRMFRPGLPVEAGRRTVAQPPEELPTSVDDIDRMFRSEGVVGHAGAIQPISRLQQDIDSSVGYRYLKGNPVPQRADFNTLDNPFSWSSRPSEDRMGEGYAAGVHFVIFTPSSDFFHRTRLAMDGVYPSGAVAGATAHDLGINAFLRTTHRQNFLVPPRVHRSFPLVELL